MDRLRAALAVLACVTVPAALAFWILGHAAVARWRRLGPGLSYAVLFAVMIALGGAVFLNRGALVRGDLGGHWVLGLLGALCYTVALSLSLRCRRQLKMRTLVGLPEFAPDRGPGPLLQEGIYGQVRHPRYLGAAFGFVAVALWANHVSTYLLLGLGLAGLDLVARLEERELVQRFGASYQQYLASVPRWWPKHWPPRSREPTAPRA